jgi:hypothetical protein
VHKSPPFLEVIYNLELRHGRIFDG